MTLLRHAVAFFASYVFLMINLICIMILVIAGTLAQKQQPSSDSQAQFFRSLFLFWQPKGLSLKIPLFPGGCLLAGLLCMNAIASLIHNYKRALKRCAIFLIHIAVVLLLIGEALSGSVTQEVLLPLKVGEKSGRALENDRLVDLPFSVELTEFVHETYPHTTIPRSFSSQINIYASGGTLLRSAHISMNHPLRYRGMTFYQSGFGQGEVDSILKIVKNPLSFSPYLFSCLLILSLVWHFVGHFFSRGHP